MLKSEANGTTFQFKCKMLIDPVDALIVVPDYFYFKAIHRNHEHFAQSANLFCIVYGVGADLSLKMLLLLTKTVTEHEQYILKMP